MSLEVYGIPNCGTCKKAMRPRVAVRRKGMLIKKAIAWMEENNVDYEFINTKDHPPDREAIASWVAALGNKPMRNTSGKSYRAIGEEKKSWNDEQWVKALSIL